MKHTTLFAALLASCQVSYAQIDSTQYFQVRDIIENTKKIAAPDKRTKILALSSSDVPHNKYTVETTEHSLYATLKEQFAPINAQVEIHLYPDATVAQRPYGLINLSVANLRTRPSHAAEMATQATLGMQVDILQKDGGDYRIRTPEGYISWVPTSSVVALDSAALQSWQQAKKIIYTQDFGKAYQSPSLKAQRVSDLVYGNILRVVAEKGKFYEVAYPDQRIAYIPKNEATDYNKWLSTRQATADNILSSAYTMLGLPYLWGGTSVKGVDCSGFTKTSFFMNGVVIPRDASQQVLHGEPVDILQEEGDFDAAKALANLQPADLLFFASGKGKSANARITHVALYIGNGEFIHAAGTVRINSMLKDASNYDDFQTRTVVAARRYIGSEDKAIQQVSNSSYYTKK